MPATYAACAAVFATGRRSDGRISRPPACWMWAPAPARQAGRRWRNGRISHHHAGSQSGLARSGAQTGRCPAAAEILPGDLAAEKPKADLVVASYVLAELPQENSPPRPSICGVAPTVLILIEPGTPDGFARIRAARAALIGAGAHVAAPCTHDNACPMAGDDWCHFSQRLPRSRDHMLLKDANVPFEDERYSYVVVTRQKAAAGARILAPPLEAKPGLTFKLCDETGLRAQFVAARDKDAYRRVRKLGWAICSSRCRARAVCKSWWTWWANRDCRRHRDCGCRPANRRSGWC